MSITCRESLDQHDSGVKRKKFKKMMLKGMNKKERNLNKNIETDTPVKL